MAAQDIAALNAPHSNLNELCAVTIAGDEPDTRRVVVRDDSRVRARQVFLRYDAGLEPRMYIQRSRGVWLLVDGAAR